MPIESKKRGGLGRPLFKLVRAAGLFILFLVVAFPGWVLLAPGDLDDAGDRDLIGAAAGRRNGGPAHLTFAVLGQALEDFDHKRAHATLVAFREGDFSDAAWVQQQFAQQTKLRDAVLAGDPADAIGADKSIDLYEETTDDGVMGLHGLTRVATAKALVLERDGLREEALDLAMFGIRAGREMAAHPDIDLIGMMISGSVQGISLASLEEIAARHPLSAESAKALSAEVSAARAQRESWQRMWANEYIWTRSVALKAFEDGTNPQAVVDVAEDDWASLLARMVPNDYLMQPNRTVSRMADLYRIRRENTGRDCVSVYTAQSEERSSFDAIGVLVRPNPVGELLVMIAHPDFERFELKRCAFEAKLALAQVVIAMRAYEVEQGDLPESMDALVPDYLVEVPTNPYVGRALRYSKIDRTVTADFEELAHILGPDRAKLLDRLVSKRSLDWSASAGS